MAAGRSAGTEAPRPGARSAAGRARGEAALLALAAAVLLLGLGRVDVWAPDEPRYVQVAEELRSFEHGASGLVLLHLNGEPYMQKPPLYFWLAALAGAPGGRVSEAAGRLPSALAGLGVIALVLALGRSLLGRETALLGGVLLLSVFSFAELSRRVQLDVLLALFETAALFCFWRIDRGVGGRGNVAALHTALGLGVLTKGPVGFLVPVWIVLVFLTWEGRLRSLVRLFPPWALLLSVGPGVLWIASALALAPAGSGQEAVGENVFGRFFAGTSHARPPWYYLLHFPVEFLPWTLLWPLVYLSGRRHVFASDAAGAPPDETRRAWRFLLSWVGASLVFFSLSTGKRDLYLLPALPAAALLCADALVRELGPRRTLPRALAAAFVALAALFAFAAAEGLLASTAGVSLVGLAFGHGARGGPVLEGVGELEAPWLAAFCAAVLVLLGLAAVAMTILTRRGAPALARVGVAVAIVLGVELAAFHALFPALDPLRSARPVAVAAAAITPPGAAIGLVGDRALTGGLVYYSGRRVVDVGTPEKLRRFVAEGGGAIVVKPRKQARVESVVPVEEVSRARAGRRALRVLRWLPEEDARENAASAR